MRPVVSEIRERQERERRRRAWPRATDAAARSRAGEHGAADGGGERDRRDEVGKAVRAVEVDDRADAVVPSTSDEMSDRLEEHRRADDPDHAAANMPRPHAASAFPHGLTVSVRRTCVSRVPGWSSRSSLPASLVAAPLRLDRGRLAADARVDVPIHGLPAGARRCSDRPPLGLPPRGAALARKQRERARGAWVARAPSRPRLHHGRPRLPPAGRAAAPALLARLDRPFVVLGNHDVAVTRDPFSRAAELNDLDRAQLLRDDADVLRFVACVSRSPVSTRSRYGRGGAAGRPDPIPRRSLRSSFATSRGSSSGSPRASSTSSWRATSTPDRSVSRPGSPDHAGPPTRAPRSGLYETDAGLMHVSPGTGTTFVPFRFFARPEVTELVLRRAHWNS